MNIYSMTARLYPMIIFYVPLVVVLLFTTFNFEQYFHYGIPVGATSLLSYLLAQIGRDRGKKIEPNLWNVWGGAPTNQLFRWSNNVIDQYSKGRFHAKMNQLCPTIHTIDRNFESNNPDAADEVYKAWTRFIISKTRDTNKYNLLFRENMSYGFRRNLLGLKPFSMGLILILATSVYVYSATSVGDWRIICQPVEFFIGEGLLSILTIFWVFVVTKRWVALPAFGYAERLLEAIDSL